MSSSDNKLNDYDLSVLDEALLYPEKTEYVDHFGFRVQVKSEHDTDSSESEFEDAQSLSSDLKTPKPDETEEEEDDTDWQSSTTADKISVVSMPTSSTTSYYDMLLSKFTRNDTPSKQLQIETYQNLEKLKEESTEDREIDWGRFVFQSMGHSSIIIF